MLLLTFHHYHHLDMTLAVAEALSSNKTQSMGEGVESLHYIVFTFTFGDLEGSNGGHTSF